MGSFLKVLGKIFGTKAEKDLKKIQPILDKVLAAYIEIDRLTNDELRAKSAELKEYVKEKIAALEQEKRGYRNQLEDMTLSPEKKEELATEVDKLTKRVDEVIEEALNDILPQAFAIMKSTARRFAENSTIEVTATDFDRSLAAKNDFVSIEGDKAIYKNQWMAGGNMITWNMVHYDVQLIGGIVLHQGKISEMATGEGKTLVATLPVFLNALAGKGVHMVTVNDYLSKRDSEWMGPLYQFHGLKVSCIDKSKASTPERREAYRADIIFGTNNEFGFDYLRDNMCISTDELVQKKHHYAIVDEVDSVLIDDARVPLIISGPVEKTENQHYDEFKPYVERLYMEQRAMVVDILNKAKKLIASGDKQEGGKLLLRAHKGLPKYKPLIKFLSETGMKQLLMEVENFYMQENNKNMHIITDELLFVIDEKQRSVEFTDKGNDAIAKVVSDPKFFVLPDVGEEVSIVEKSDLSDEEKANKRDEILSDYSVKAERVHTVSQLLKAYTMFDIDVEYVIQDGKIKIVDEQTGRILDGRRYSDGLHQALEAKENVKVEDATQTFATITLQNYFRMYHKLAGMTGTAETEAGEFDQIYKLDVVTIPTNRPIARLDNDDFIYRTRKGKFNAVIERVAQLQKEGRPVLVGTTSVEVSESLSRMLKLRGIKHNVLNAKYHDKEAAIVAEAGQRGAVTIATNMAGRGTDIKLGEGVKELGGLAIIGTERHDSRRVDRQLRGRAGRQGDPGSSEFYVSFEDNLLRLFGGDRIAKVVDRMGMAEDELLQTSMLSNAIENAQKKVEENNYGIRKRLLEYDDVMNYQREVIYNKRRNALYGERIEVDLKNMIADYAELFAMDYRKSAYNIFRLELAKQISVESGITEQEFGTLSADDLCGRVEAAIKDTIKRRMDSIINILMPFIKKIYDDNKNNILQLAPLRLPVSDGSKVFGIQIDIPKAYENNGQEIYRVIAKTITLIMIDEYWKEHLRDMDDLKQQSQNATYAQKDPVVYYKNEGFGLFTAALDNIAKEVISFLTKAHIPLRVDDNNVQNQEVKSRKRDMTNMKLGRTDLVTNGPDEKSNAPIRVEKKVGRNELCPCGSGKKYKNCHGKEE